MIAQQVSIINLNMINTIKTTLAEQIVPQQLPSTLKNEILYYYSARYIKTIILEYLKKHMSQAKVPEYPGVTVYLLVFE